MSQSLTDLVLFPAKHTSQQCLSIGGWSLKQLKQHVSPDFQLFVISRPTVGRSFDYLYCEIFEAGMPRLLRQEIHVGQLFTDLSSGQGRRTRSALLLLLKTMVIAKEFDTKRLDLEITTGFEVGECPLNSRSKYLTVPASSRPRNWTEARRFHRRQSHRFEAAIGR